MTDDSGVRAVIYVLKEDPDCAVFDRDIHGKEAQHLGTWDEYAPAGLVVAKDATFAHDSYEVDDDILMEVDDHVLMLPKGERLNACQVMAGDGLGLGVTVVPLPRPE